VLTWPQFDAWLAKIEAAELTALDTETTSLDSFEARIVGISLSVTPGSLLHAARPHRPRCRRPAAARRGAGPAEALA
jgi:DNA polymerase-1